MKVSTLEGLGPASINELARLVEVDTLDQQSIKIVIVEASDTPGKLIHDLRGVIDTVELMTCQMDFSGPMGARKLKRLQDCADFLKDLRDRVVEPIFS